MIKLTKFLIHIFHNFTLYKTMFFDLFLLTDFCINFICLLPSSLLLIKICYIFLYRFDYHTNYINKYKPVTFKS